MQATDNNVVFITSHELQFPLTSRNKCINKVQVVIILWSDIGMLKKTVINDYKHLNKMEAI